jgi:acetyltransferase-like isoleucine patch superfamily enzyme
MKFFLRTLANLLIYIAYKAYKAEGINALLLVLPAKMIAPLLRQHGARIGENIEIHSPLIIHNASEEPGMHYANLRIGSDCYFGRDVFFDLKDRIVIEDQVTVSMRVTILTHTDVGKSPLASQLPPSHAPVIIRHGAYFGSGVTILQGVEVGEQAIIGAGALVDHSVAPHTIVAGVPARLIRSLADTEKVAK